VADKEQALPSAAATASLSIQRALSVIRQHLGMDVAYLSEFVDGRSVFRVVDAPGLEALIKPGDVRSLDEVYCRHILEGRLPELIPDTSREPIAAALPITRMVPIGSHMSIPIRLQDGEVYGMFCCLSARPNPSLNLRDLATMRMFADLAAERVADQVAEDRTREAKRRRLRQVVDNKGLALLFQPIVDLATDAPNGFECLSRFQTVPYRPPNLWFGEAAEVGMGEELEVAAIRAALACLPDLPAEIYLSVNASPHTVLGDRLAGLLETLRPGEARRLMLEITEHAPVTDYGQLDAALAPLRARGMMLAIDDAGAGFASFNHILQLRPDVIKLDMGLVRDIDKDPTRRSLAAAMTYFARETGTLIVAEGIETEGEKQTLRALGINKGQGYLPGRPMPLDAARALFQSSPKERLSA